MFSIYLLYRYICNLWGDTLNLCKYSALHQNFYLDSVSIHDFCWTDLYYDACKWLFSNSRTFSLFTIGHLLLYFKQELFLFATVFDYFAVQVFPDLASRAATSWLLAHMMCDTLPVNHVAHLLSIRHQEIFPGFSCTYLAQT